MPSGRESIKDVLDGNEINNSGVPVKLHGHNATEPTTLLNTSAKAGGLLARWFKLREFSTPTRPSQREKRLSSVSRLEETAGYGTDNEEDDESFNLDSTAATNSKPKIKNKPHSQIAVDTPKRRRSTSDHSNSAGGIRQPRVRRRSSTSKSSGRTSDEMSESNSKRGERAPTPLQKLLILETQEQNERNKTLEAEMAEKLEEIKEIRKLQIKKKVEKEIASSIAEKRTDDQVEATTPQETDEDKRNFKEKLKLDVEEEMKAKVAASRSHIDNMRIKLKNEYTNHAKALMQEYEKKFRRELTPALAEAKNKVRQEAAEEAQRFEAFVRAHIAHECKKIDDDCDQKIEVVNRERKERQLAVKQKGKDTIENRQKTQEKKQHLDEKETSAYSTIDLSEKERLQKHKDAVEADLAEREALHISALEREAAQKLGLTRTILEEQSREKLHEYNAKIERQAADSRPFELWDSEVGANDSNRPQRSVIEEQLLQRKAKTSQKTQDSYDHPVLKTSLKTAKPNDPSAPKVGKKVLF
ncbi:hypothetical protein R1flu_011481 [Riccia fluitans]|uniref:Uncharacterized protein n=1 Tax=Riccia fluitans TaxID=41844 RepID=A0ABD1ZAJ1_9MARC